MLGIRGNNPAKNRYWNFNNGFLGIIARSMCYFRTSHTSLVHGKLHLKNPNFSVEIFD